jgi:hypothetical protein
MYNHAQWENRSRGVMNELEEAIESLYRTFARYPRPLQIETCPCGCTKPGATLPFVGVPLRELNFADLADYSFSAMTTQGSVDDFRYLLPRLFHGITAEQYDYNPEILFGKLSYAEWLQWPQDEVAAVRTYLQAIWKAGLASFPIQERLPAFYEIETLLASIANAGDDLEPYLEIWTRSKNIEADQHLVEFVTNYGTDFSNGRTFHEALWKDAPAQAKALRAWLLQTDTLQRIADHADLIINDGCEHLFGPALAILQSEPRSE